MEFLHTDLGILNGGEVIEVTLSGSQANVKLMDSSNFQYYKSGKNHRFYGGLAKTSPIRINIPNSGHWYVTIDLGGYAGSLQSSVRIIK